MLTTEDRLEVLRLNFQASKMKELAKSQGTEEPIFLEDVCQLTNYSRHTIYGLVSRNEIPFVKLAGRQKLLFYKSKILDWMNGLSKEVVNG